MEAFITRATYVLLCPFLRELAVRTECMRRSQPKYLELLVLVLVLYILEVVQDTIDIISELPHI